MHFNLGNNWIHHLRSTTGGMEATFIFQWSAGSVMEMLRAQFFVEEVQEGVVR